MDVSVVAGYIWESFLYEMIDYLYIYAPVTITICIQCCMFSTSQID